MWSVLFATALGDKTIDRFDCKISTLSRYIGKNGALSATIPVPNSAVGDRCQAIAGRAGQLTAYVYHGDELWWGGLVNATPIKGGRTGPSLGVSGAVFDSYLDRREVRTPYTYRQTEQVEIIRDAWQSVQRDPGGNLGILVPPVPPSGIRRDLDVARSEARTWSKVIKEIAGLDDGYEWIIDFYDDGQGRRVRELKVGYPQIGRPDKEQLFSYPGNILDYDYDADALAGATSYQGRGDSVGEQTGNTQQPLMTSLGAFDAADLLASGSLKTDATIDRQGVTDLGTLNSWTQKALNRGAGAVPFLDITVSLGGFNQSILGSVFRAQIDDLLFRRGPDGEPGYIGRHRCIGYEIKAPQRGDVGEVKLIIEET